MGTYESLLSKWLNLKPLNYEIELVQTPYDQLHINLYVFVVLSAIAIALECMDVPTPARYLYKPTIRLLSRFSKFIMKKLLNGRESFEWSIVWAPLSTRFPYVRLLKKKLDQIITATRKGGDKNNKS